MYKLNPLEKLTIAATITSTMIACGKLPEKKIDDYHNFPKMEGSMSWKNPRGEVGDYKITLQPYDANRDLDTPKLRWAIDIVATGKDAAPRRVWADGPQPTNPGEFQFENGLIEYKVGGECRWGEGADKDETCKGTQKQIGSDMVADAIEATLKQNNAK